VKIESPDVPHKTEAGAVRLGVQDLAGLKQAAREIVAAARKHHPDARIEGVLVQEMATGLEVIVGAVNDATFGPTVAFGLGGIFTELLRDVTHCFAPFDADAARGMIGEIRGAALLNGYRGRPALDVAALADALARASQLIADHADRIAEIDVNPLFVREKGVVAADALIVLK
jgi:acetyltransferase